MRTVFAAVLLAGTTAACSAAEKAKLGIGDPAPRLAVTKWLQGDPVSAFAPGKVYVVDFWATWCGPCIASMPHLNELAAEYKDQGLVAVAVTTTGPNNTAEVVAEFVKKKGSKYGFGYAYCDDEAMDKAYMLAAGQEGIPCSFVVDKAGKIAFIGHPMELDDVLPKVIAGTWRGQADADEIAKANKALDAILEGADADPAAALVALADFAKVYPDKAKQDMFAIRQVVVLLKAKKADEAKAVTEPLLKKYTEKKNAGGLGMLRSVWTSKELNPRLKYVEIGLAAADAALAADAEGGPMALIQAAQAYFAAGKPERAVELAEKAVAAAENPRQKEFLQKQVKRYKGEKDEPKKDEPKKDEEK